MPPLAELSPGTVFAGDYRIVRPLAEGGMGVIYVAEQISTRRQRALKLMQRELVQSVPLREKFEREARLPSSIESDHVAEVLAAGVDGSTGLPWFAMELLEGETLEQRVQRAGPTAYPEALAIFEQVCHALSAAHRKGIVHRDLKPENVFLAKRRGVGMPYVVKVLDFGIAKVVAEATLTNTGVMGTPLYMAPEQYQGRGIRPQTDLWALGLMLFYVLSGRIYWRGANSSEPSAAALMYETCMGELPAASVRAREEGVVLPVDLDGWFASCVAREPELRFASADAAFSALRSVQFGAAEALAVPAPQPALSPTLGEGTLMASPLSVAAAQRASSEQQVRAREANVSARPSAVQRTPAAVVVSQPGSTQRRKPRRVLVSALAGVVGVALVGALAVRPTHSSATKEAALADSARTSARLPVTDQDPARGPADAPVTLVEFADFQCPFCKRVNATLKELEAAYPKQLRLVFKHNPLPFHEHALAAAQAASAVFSLAGNSAFWKFHDQAFEHQAELNDENFEAWAAAAGVDRAKFKAAYAAKKYATKIDADMALAKQVGALGTPAFRINGVTVNGAQPIEKFKEVIDQQLVEAKKLLASGTRARDVYALLTDKNQPVDPPPAEKSAEAEEDKFTWRVPVAADDPVRGAKDALVTIVAYSDFQCPFCKRVEDTLTQVRDAYRGDVRIVWKDNPLPFHPRAKPAAEFARFVYVKQGNKAFWDAHDALFASQPKLDDEDLHAIAQNLGIDWNQAKNAIDQQLFDERIQRSADQADDFQARGTPHFFINGRRLSGAQPFEKFKALIDEQLALGRAAVARGTARADVYDALTRDGKGPPPPERKLIPAPDATDPAIGPSGALVTVQIFSDFQCPFCKRVEPTLQSLEQAYAGRVRFVWRDLPLPFHKDAPLAAEAAREAFAQQGNRGFWKYHDRLFEAQPDIDRASLEKLAEQSGLDLSRFKAALDTHVHKAKVEADAKLATVGGVDGTPAFVINGYFLSGAQPESAFRKLIERALQEAHSR